MLVSRTARKGNAKKCMLYGKMHKVCASCTESLGREAFKGIHESDDQWFSSDKERKCIKCREKAKTKKCSNCGLWKGETAFAPKYHQNWSLRTRVCTDCDERRVCRGKCKESKGEPEFTASEWAHAGKPHGTQGKCKKCMLYGKEHKVCASCTESLAREAFKGIHESDDQWFSNDKERKCIKCREKAKTQKCSKCNKYFKRDGFQKLDSSDDQWNSKEKDRKCIHCRKIQSVKGMWKCVDCPAVLPKEVITQWHARNPSGTKNKSTKCNACFDAGEKKENSAPR